MTRLVVILTSTLLATACRDRTDSADRTGYSKPSETANDDFAHTRSSYGKQMNERLQQLDARIHELAAKGTEKAKQAADELRVERDRLAPQVDEIGKQAREGWDNFESELSRGFDNLEQKLNDALEHD
ncbi:MAG TPA: hypothetical protein VFV99_23010 [Kofleriaceae bacterium]|nr:hypothetical protein [Kofleriaceae bacterium]